MLIVQHLYSGRLDCSLGAYLGYRVVFVAWGAAHDEEYFDSCGVACEQGELSVAEKRDC
jgi:hypothetical protein